MIFQKAIAVRGLVEFVYQSGDIDLRFKGKRLMLEGTKIHQKIQASQGLAYTPEVSLSCEKIWEQEQMLLKVSGRADGILKQGDHYLVDEIKGTQMSLDRIDEKTHPVYWAQAKIYAYIFALNHHLKSIDVQLTYVSFQDEQIKRLILAYSFEELESFWSETLERYKKWMSFQKSWVDKRQASIAAADFPFKGYRKGQKDLMSAVYKSIKSSKILFANAPTGIGKTLSTLFPAVKNMGEGHVDKIFYLSAKAVAKKIAEDAVTLLREQSHMTLRLLTITAKEKICPLDQLACYPEKCPRAKGHYDRSLDCIWDMLHDPRDWNRETIEFFAEKHCVCPYEMALDLSQQADVIISDYNYVFDPNVYLRRYFDVVLEAYVFLVDEAHNLVDRARNMYSAEIRKDQLLELKKKLSPKDHDVKKSLEGINREILQLRKNCDEKGVWISREEPESLYQAIKKRVPKIEKWLTDSHDAHAYDEVLNFYFDLLHYMKISEMYGEHYLTYITDGNEPQTVIKLFCIQPSPSMRPYLLNARSTVFFSATLSPLGYYKDMFCNESHAVFLDLPSPFPVANRWIRYLTDLSVTYREREESLPALLAVIAKVVEAKCGNYMVFFPSYDYMMQCYEAFKKIYPNRFELCFQDKALNENDRVAFVEQFREDKSSLERKSLLAFVVMGSHFSEGIDLKGNQLIGSIVVGLGLSQFNFENQLIHDYFNGFNGKGFQFAYQFPGVNKVMQSAGRVIRGEEDQGIILLVDSRYRQAQYVQFFPKDWEHRLTSSYHLVREVEKFWKGLSSPS